MNRAQRRQREKVTQRLREHIATHGIESFLNQMFGPGGWQYDAREQLWIVPDAAYTGPGRRYYCVRANGDWFGAQFDDEQMQ
jgi:hypothetical protein